MDGRGDTDQLGLGFGFNRGENNAVGRVAAGIAYFAPAMNELEGGWVRFDISHRDWDICAWELRFSRVRGNAQLARAVRGQEEGIIDFPSLLDALRYVEANLWCQDIIETDAEMMQLA